ncbi:putative aspartic-type endopeptidase opsB [Cladobotryum mycophilum]|uniref:Aspartic-type endopeptidase opsB n=1 Tax=Cladobotryum mycophilum TaxID=491253 RepID=A0ABR0SN86_9HYPO
MRYSFSLAALPLAAQAMQFLDDNSYYQGDGLSRHPITVAGGAPHKSMRKRQNEASLRAQKLGFFYTIDIGIGTPAQTVSVNFDTGSSELWVNPICSKSTDEAFCEGFGRYNESTTFVDAKAPGGVRYGTGYVDFDYGYDYVEIGSARVKQQLFGVATDSEFASVGILGAGPSLDGWTSPYPFVIDTMAQQGLIKSRAFSLDIRSLGSDRGSVIFGGIDTKKFSGHLEKRPIIPADDSPDGYTRYWIYLDGITITKEDGTDLKIFDKPNSQPVLLDSGYTISTLPGPIFDEILKAFPSAKEDDDSGEYFVDCGVTKTKGMVNFKFGKTIINVPYDDFIWHQEDGTCKLGVAQDDDFPVLGDTFLRAVYLVYDWDNRNVHLANNEDCGSNLLPIGKGVDAVPSVLGDCGAPATTSTSAPVSTSTKVPLTTAPATHTSGATGGPGSGTLYPTTSLWQNSTAPASHTTAAPTLTSTFTVTQVHTITSCAPTVTNCPVGHVTTEIITSYTTYCPGEDKTAAPTPITTSQYQEITATYTIPRTYTCSKGLTTCASQTPVHIITVSPIVTQTAPVEVPHCTSCATRGHSSHGIASTPILTHPVASPSSPAATIPVVPVVSAPPAVTYPVSTPPPAPAATGGLTTVVNPSGAVPSGVVPSGAVPPQGNPSTIPVSGASDLCASSIAALVVGALAVAFL